MNTLRSLVVIVLALATAHAAWATDRFFPDSFALSPSGVYRIDAKSPDNAPGRDRAFASQFTYTLTETATKRVIWERQQPMVRSKGSPTGYPGEPSPVQVWVTDEGLVVARTSADTIIILDPRNGERRGEAQILGAFPKNEYDQYVQYTTAGPRWSGLSDWFFFSVPATGSRPAALYFVVRPFWHHRVIVDCATAKHVDLSSYHSALSLADVEGAPAPIKELLTKCISYERQRAVEVLSKAPETLKDTRNYRGYWDVMGCLHAVVFLKVEEAEPALRRLEKESPLLHDFSEKVQGKVREALRAIGKTPLAGCGVRIDRYASSNSYRPSREAPATAAKIAPEVRTANAPTVVAGMTRQRLTELLGCPDAQIGWSSGLFDYDIDASPPYTLRVQMSANNAAVASVRVITPLAFLHDAERIRRD